MFKRQVMTILLGAFVACFWPSYGFAINEILNIRYWVAPDHTRVVIDTTRKPLFNLEKDEQKVIIHFVDTALSKDVPSEIILNKPGISKISISSPFRKVVSVELSLSDHADTNLFTLKKFQQKPDRVVIDISFPDIEKKESQAREQVRVLEKEKIIVIDPGHGGEDPGAIGRRGTYEKNVVLDIAKRLKLLLDQSERYRAFLTREGDYYVPFKKRLKIAREYGADLFLSIHADASRNRRAVGSSVYCLSIGGASSVAAKLLARNENLADIIGGYSNGESNDESDPIVLNMCQTNTINLSKAFGYELLKVLNVVSQIKYNDVQAAPFIVLKLPEIPSVLVETAFISNPKEERLLRNNSFKNKVVQAMAKAIGDFLQIPVPPSKIPLLVTATTEQEIVSKAQPEAPLPVVSPQAVYTVKKGDSLSNIAIKHQTTLAILLKLNGMKMGEPLYVGRKVKVPVPDQIDESLVNTGKQSRISSKAGYIRYRVKKGDSLNKIAKTHQTTIGTLLKLNGMAMNDPLYVGRILNIKQVEDGAADDKKTNKPSIQVKRKVFIYKVKKGDTLLKLAKDCNTNITELLRLNHMKISDSLLVDQKLKLPKAP
jgi:N-acetylmuramoyl-L-alanine amidase